MSENEQGNEPSGGGFYTVSILSTDEPDVDGVAVVGSDRGRVTSVTVIGHVQRLRKTWRPYLIDGSALEETKTRGLAIQILLAATE